MKLQLSQVLKQINEEQEFDEVLESLFDIHDDLEDDMLETDPDVLDDDGLNEDDDLNEAELFEDDEKQTEDYKKLSEEDLKIEALKIATNIAKLMSDVTTEDIIVIADKVSAFIRNHEIGENTEEAKKSEDKEENKEEEDEFLDFEVPEEKEEQQEEENEEAND